MGCSGSTIPISRSCDDLKVAKADEDRSRDRLFVLQTQGRRLGDVVHGLVKRVAVRAAAAQRRHGDDEDAVLVLLDEHRQMVTLWLLGAFHNEMIANRAARYKLVAISPGWVARRFGMAGPGGYPVAVDRGGPIAAVLADVELSTDAGAAVATAVVDPGDHS